MRVMSRAVGIDIGTSEVKVIVAERGERGELPRVVAAGRAESAGMRQGFVVNVAEASRAIARAVRIAERALGSRIDRAYLGVGGAGLGSATSLGASMVSRADGEITELDQKRAADEAERAIPAPLSQNRKVVHMVPLEHRIDGRKVMGDPVGMKGVRLESKCLFVTAVARHVDDAIEALEGAGIEAADAMAAPFAAALVSVAPPQRVAGCALVNIGAETTTIAVYEDGSPISVEAFPVGASSITNDVALALRVSLEEAEALRREPASLSSSARRTLDEAVSARATDILDLVDGHLRRLGRSGLLPAGAIFVGGAAGVPNIAELAKEHLRLPARVATIPWGGGRPPLAAGEAMPDAAWAVAYGLAAFGLSADGDGAVRGRNALVESLRRGFRGFWRSVRQFLP
jgi:cell division protein FtsA